MVWFATEIQCQFLVKQKIQVIEWGAEREKRKKEKVYIIEGQFLGGPEMVKEDAKYSSTKVSKYPYYQC